MCLERAHAQRVGQGQGLTVRGFGQLGLRGMAVRVDLAEEPQGPGLLTLLCVHAEELQATHRKCQRLVEAAEAQIRLAQPDMNADFRSPKSINILGLLEKLTGTGRPPGDSATKE